MASEGEGPSLYHPATPDVERLEASVGVLRLLADPTRLHLLWHLSQQPRDVGGLVELTATARTVVSQHLAKLRLAGIVVATRNGRNITYALQDGHLSRLITEALNYGDHLVTGEPSHD